MPNKRRQQNKRQRRQRTITRRAFQRVKVQRTQPNSPLSSTFNGAMRVARIASALLPIKDLPDYVKLAQVIFNFIVSKIGGSSYYRGAYSMVNITPGALVYNSPLLAKDTSGKYTFPGYPIQMKWINIKILNTTQHQERSGRWAAVFIPFRELHDKDHYTKVLENFTYSEVASMPYARSASSGQPINIHYKMRSLADYCARPRELGEEIGVLFMVWDHPGRGKDQISTAFTNTEFSCDIEFSAGLVPHVIFGSQHRIVYEPSVFDVKCLTNGKVSRVHDGDLVYFVSNQETDFEML